VIAVGVDGYPRGWVTVALEVGRPVSVAAFDDFRSVLEAYPAADAFGVDIPIGLPETEPRPADLAARRFLGGRSSAVFLTFPRRVLEAGTHAEAVAMTAELGWPGISQQSFGLRRKILEVDAFRGDDRVVEVHPEISFAELAGAPLESKHTPAGLAGRRAVLVAAGVQLPDDLPRAPLVDALDAAAAAWSAARYAREEALPLPADATERIGAIWR
jgi:predicted RNase H-like nuclease